MTIQYLITNVWFLLRLKWSWNFGLKSKLDYAENIKSVKINACSIHFKTRKRSKAFHTFPYLTDNNVTFFTWCGVNMQFIHQLFEYIYYRLRTFSTIAFPFAVLFNFFERLCELESKLILMHNRIENVFVYLFRAPTKLLPIWSTWLLPWIAHK